MSKRGFQPWGSVGASRDTMSRDELLTQHDVLRSTTPRPLALSQVAIQPLLAHTNSSASKAHGEAFDLAYKLEIHLVSFAKNADTLFKKSLSWRTWVSSRSSLRTTAARSPVRSSKGGT
jgi:hypothetical protein